MFANIFNFHFDFTDPKEPWGSPRVFTPHLKNTVLNDLKFWAAAKKRLEKKRK